MKTKRVFVANKIDEINRRLRNYCHEKNIDFFDNSNFITTKEKLHQNKKGKIKNSILAKNISKY